MRNLFIVALLLLLGCESVSERQDNERRDVTTKDQDREIVRLQQRVEELDRRPHCTFR